MKLISTIFAALLLAAGAAHADINDKDNHVEGVGGHTPQRTAKARQTHGCRCEEGTRSAEELGSGEGQPHGGGWRSRTP